MVQIYGIFSAIGIVAEILLYEMGKAEHKRLQRIARFCKMRGLWVGFTKIALLKLKKATPNSSETQC